jgi:hypothetical protein
LPERHAISRAARCPGGGARTGAGGSRRKRADGEQTVAGDDWDSGGRIHDLSASATGRSRAPDFVARRQEFNPAARFPSSGFRLADHRLGRRTGMGAVRGA